jgi:glycosyltransferase involved in cell wall biosynthesis
MVNIGFLPESLGGTEFYTYNLAKALISRGDEVVVLTALHDSSRKRYNVIRTTFDGISVIKIVNGPLFATSRQDFFLDPKVDQLFSQILTEERPNLVHFQHVAYLSGNLVSVAQQVGIPSIFTLHDYWYLCFRSQLLRPDVSVCAGPAGGMNCATCDDGITPHPMSVPRFPGIVRFINRPDIRQIILNIMARVPQTAINKIRALLFGGAKEKTVTLINPDAATLSENRFRFDFFKRQLELPAFVLSPSYHLKHRYEREGFREISVVPLGFKAVTPVEPLPYRDALQLAFIGNIERHKGVHIVLQELLPLLESRARVQINIYGRAKDPIYFSLAQKLAAAYPAGSVVFHGAYRSDRDLRRIFANTHLAVFPSLWEENYPLVIREALLHGVPVIGSRLGGVPEVIKNGINGYMFDPFQAGDFRRVVSNILAEPQVLAQLADGARNTPIELMPEHLEKMVEIYIQTSNMSVTAHLQE